MDSEQMEKWNAYQKEYNELSDELVEKGIDYKKLRNVVNYLEEYFVSCRSFCPSDD